MSSFLRNARAAPNAASLTCAAGRASIKTRTRSGHPTGSAPPPPSALDRTGACCSSTSVLSITLKKAQCTSRSKHSLASSASPGCASSHSAPTAVENAVGTPIEVFDVSGGPIGDIAQTVVATGVFPFGNKESPLTFPGVETGKCPPGVVAPKSVDPKLSPRRSGHSAAASLAKGNGGSLQKSAYLEHRSHTASVSPTIPGSTPKSHFAEGGVGTCFLCLNRLARSAAAVASAEASALAKPRTGRASAECLLTVGGEGAAKTVKSSALCFV